MFDREFASARGYNGTQAACADFIGAGSIGVPDVNIA
jgi:hypothetical protein